MEDQINIVIVDDDPLLLGTIEAILDSEGYQISLANNGNQALRLVNEIKPRLVITDIVMPEKEGIETIMELRAQHPDIKIIAMSGSGHQMDQYLSNAQTLGADDIIAKPFTPTQLVDLIKAVLSR